MNIAEYVNYIDQLSEKSLYKLNNYNINEPLKIDSQLISDFMHFVDIKRELITDSEKKIVIYGYINPVINLDVDSETKILLTSIYIDLINNIRKKEFIRSFEKYNENHPIFKGNDLFNYVRDCVAEGRFACHYSNLPSKAWQAKRPSAISKRPSATSNCHWSIDVIIWKWVMEMPRSSREISKTGIYHVMLRGIDKRDIFMSKWDYGRFLEDIKKAKGKSDFAVYGYCLMTNHVHMLLKTGQDEIGDIVKRIAIGYAQYHNIRNGRTGHLFQNRFKSEVVETYPYFITVLRYIHQNPVKAGLTKDVKYYKWSSYNEYIDKGCNFLVDTAFALGFFPDVKAFEKFMRERNDDKCLEHDTKIRYSDEDLKIEIARYGDTRNLYELDIRKRDELLKTIKDNTGASNRQLARVLNIGRGILERIK